MPDRRACQWQVGRHLVLGAMQGFLPEGSMRRHDWISDLLTDLRDYATANGLSELACSVETTLAVARREAALGDGQTDGQTDRHPACSARLQ